MGIDNRELLMCGVVVAPEHVMTNKLEVKQPIINVSHGSPMQSGAPMQIAANHEVCQLKADRQRGWTDPARPNSCSRQTECFIDYYIQQPVSVG